jgi:hypothetical protein
VSNGAKTALAALLIVASLLLVGAVAYFMYASERDKIVVNEQLCPVDGSVKGHVAVVVDWTDPFTSQQRDALKDLISQIRRRMQVQERLSLFLITGNPEDAGTALFSYCKPLDPDHVNPLIENERRLKDKWNAQFGKPLDDALAKLLQGSVAPFSPILEALDIMLWAHNFQGDLPRRELVIFSDLLQNSATQNDYKRAAIPCALINTPLGQRLAAKNWSELRVTLHYWRNPQAQGMQGPRHLAFWTQLFYLLGATEVYDGSRLVQRDPATTTCGVSTPFTTSTVKAK